MKEPQKYYAEQQYQWFSKICQVKDTMLVFITVKISL